MGVNIYILDRRPARLTVGGLNHKIGSLRRSWKITELDAERSSELAASEAAARLIESPPAALVADISEFPIGSADSAPVKAHLVLGWDHGRTSVTDMGWDYLPTIGYGVRDPATGFYALHELQAGALHPISRERAEELGLIDGAGKLVRRGQPKIIQCSAVRRYIAGYAEADCVLDNGAAEKLMIGLDNASLPEPSWLVGKKPMDAVRYSQAG